MLRVRQGQQGSPSDSDVKWKSDKVRRHHRRDVVLLIVDSANDGEQGFFNGCLELCVAPGSDCKYADKHVYAAQTDTSIAIAAGCF